MNRYLKIVLWFFGILVGLAILILGVVYFRPQLFAVPFLKYEFRESKYPQMYVIPIERRITGIEELSVKQKVNLYDISFDVPWDGKTEKKVYGNNGDVTLLKFPNEVSVTVFDKRSDENDIRKTMKDKIKEELGKYPGVREENVTQSMFGNVLNGSKYEAEKAISYVTPEQIRISDSMGEIIGETILVVLKGLMASLGKMYIFQAGEVNVIEFAYDISSDSSRIAFVFTKNDDRYDVMTSKITQDELDFMLASIRTSSR